MGTIKKGILGGFSGKVGTVIGASWKGIDYMRSLPKKSSKPPTQLQLDVRARMALAMGFLNPVLPLIRVGYQSYNGDGTTPINTAVAELIKGGITGTSPNFVVDFDKVSYSKGELSGPWTPEIETTVAGELTFNWAAQPVSPVAQPTDQLTLVVYNPAKDKYVFLSNAAVRSALTVDLLLPLDFSGDTVHSYMFFVSQDGKQVSSTFYAGEMALV